MTDQEIQKLLRAGRCENCGGTKAEHRKRGAKCPTRLTDTRYLPWTPESLALALEMKRRMETK